MSVEINQAVDNFTVQTTGGEISLSQLRGKSVVLYFYPKDSTPGCTTEGENFRDAHPQFQASNAVVLGISRDSMKSHANFKAKLELPFELISDPEEALCLQFDVMKMKNMYGKQVRGVERSTFLIDPQGILKHEWRGVKVPGHVEEVLSFLKTL
jgi:peroxiredoxin Q/BCP